MSDLKHLNLKISKTQDNIGLVNMSDQKYLDLTINQTQGNIQKCDKPKILEFDNQPNTRRY